MSMTDRTINWGIVGCGWVARDYVAPGMLNAPNTRLIALCDPDEAAMQRIAAQAPDAACYTDLDVFLTTPDLHAVYVATPNHLHRPIVEAAARAGKHVLSEKPMATNVADAERMVQACAKAGVQYGTAFDQRWHVRHRRLRELIADGALGTITAVRIHYACWTPGDWKPDTDDGRHDNWRIDPQRAGGGAFIDLAPHGLDLSQWLVGEDLIEVACLFQRRVFNYPVDDGAALIGQFTNGALLSHNVAYNCPDTFPRRILEVIGTTAMAVARNTMGQTPGGTLHLIAASDSTSTAIEVAPEDDVSPFQTQVAAFSQCLVDGVPFPFSPQRDLHTMRLLQTAMAGQVATLKG
jgi:predicted dehydrogenase